MNMEDHLSHNTHQTYWGKENQNQIKDPFLDPQQRQMMEYMMMFLNQRTTKYLDLFRKKCYFDTLGVWNLLHLGKSLITCSNILLFPTIKVKVIETPCSHNTILIGIL